MYAHFHANTGIESEKKERERERSPSSKQYFVLFMREKIFK